MSGFIANGPVPSGHINSDPFWPTIELEHVRANLRIDSSVDPARLEVAVIAAVISVNRELRAWRLEKSAAGYAELAEVPSDKVRDTSELVQLYLRAVQSATAAEVAERYRWYDTTTNGNDKAQDIATTIDDYRRDQRWAIRDFLKRPRTTVELI